MGQRLWFIDPRVRFIGHLSGSYRTNVDTGNWRMYTSHAYFETTAKQILACRHAYVYTFQSREALQVC